MQTLDLFNGKKIIAYDNNDFISNTISQFKCWEPNVTDTFIQILKKYKTPTVFDVGCNIGYFSLISSDQCDKIFSFDSNKKNIDFLTKSIKINNINNIQTMTCCVSDETNLFYKMQDTNDANIGALKMVSCGKEDTDVTTIVLDDFIEKNNIQEVSILKIDIEGFELKCLNGLKKSFENGIIKNIIIEVTPLWGLDEANKILELLLEKFNLYNIGLVESSNYEFYYENILKNKINSLSDIKNDYERGVQTNILATLK